jgi:hypothetical protein
MVVVYRRGDDEEIRLVSKRVYQNLNSELMSNAGYHTFKVKTEEGVEVTLVKAQIRSVRFVPNS